MSCPLWVPVCRPPTPNSPYSHLLSSVCFFCLPESRSYLCTLMACKCSCIVYTLSRRNELLYTDGGGRGRGEGQQIYLFEKTACSHRPGCVVRARRILVIKWLLWSLHTWRPLVFYKVFTNFFVAKTEIFPV